MPLFGFPLECLCLCLCGYVGMGVHKCVNVRVLVLHGQTASIASNCLGMYVEKHLHSSFLQHQYVSSILPYIYYVMLLVQAMQVHTIKIERVWYSMNQEYMSVTRRK